MKYDESEKLQLHCEYRLMMLMLAFLSANVKRIQAKLYDAEIFRHLVKCELHRTARRMKQSQLKNFDNMIRHSKSPEVPSATPKGWARVGTVPKLLRLSLCSEMKG